MYEKRLEFLEEAHRLLNNQVDQMEKSSPYDADKLQEMKKRKLLYKDEIAKLRRLQWEYDREHNDDDWDY